MRAMKDRNRTALAVFRSALAAIDNAEAVPLSASDRAGAMELSLGHGLTEVQRQSLSEQDMIDLVRREVAERRAAAESLIDVNPAVAEQLSGEADVLRDLVELAVSRAAGTG